MMSVHMFTCSPARLVLPKAVCQCLTLCDEAVCVCVCVCTLGGEACVCVCVCWLMALREDAQQQWSLQLVFLPPHKHALYCGVISHCPDKWVTICTGSKCVCMCSEID